MKGLHYFDRIAQPHRKAASRLEIALSPQMADEAHCAGDGRDAKRDFPAAAAGIAQCRPAPRRNLRVLPTKPRPVRAPVALAGDNV